MQQKSYSLLLFVCSKAVPIGNTYLQTQMDHVRRLESKKVRVLKSKQVFPPDQINPE